MSNAIVNPLLDSCLTQLTAIRGVLGERAEIHAIDAAKAQLLSIKYMLSDDEIPRLPKARPEQTRLGLNDGDFVEQTDLRMPARTRSLAVLSKKDKELIKQAILKIVKAEGHPVASRFIFDLLQENWRKYKLKTKPNEHQLKSNLRTLHQEGRLTKKGDRNSTEYSLSN